MSIFCCYNLFIYFTCEAFESEDDDVTLSAKFPKILSSGAAVLPLKRELFDNCNLLVGSVKKSKVFASPVDGNDEDDDDHVPISWRMNRSALSFSLLKEKLVFVEKSFEECVRKRRVEEMRLKSIERDIVECNKVLENKTKLAGCVRRMGEIHKKMMGKIEGCVKDFVGKEAQLCLIEDLIGERKQELRVKEMELGQVMNRISKEREFECQMKELVGDLMLKQKHFEWRTMELELKEKKHEGLVMNWELKEKEFDGRVKEFDSKEAEFERQVKELESEKKQLHGRVKEFDSKETEFEGRLKELELEKKQFEGRVKEFDSKEDEFQGRLKKLESEKKHLESRLKEFESKEKKFKEQMKEPESKEEEFKEKVMVFESKEEEFESRVKEFNSKEKQFQSKIEDFKSKETQFEERWKALESKEKQFEGQVKDLESELNKHEGKESATSYIDDESNLPIDETSLQLVSCEQSDILAILRETSDPAKLVLDIILNPILQLCDQKENNDVIIDDKCIYLLEQLMKISPNIKPRVREEAMKLALELKANIKENTQNSLVVLGFLLILSIYGLLTSFDEDEVVELFASVAQHKIALELFRPLSFAN